MLDIHETLEPISTPGGSAAEPAEELATPGGALMGADTADGAVAPAAGGGAPARPEGAEASNGAAPGGTEEPMPRISTRSRGKSSAPSAGVSGFSVKRTASAYMPPLRLGSFAV